MSILLCPCNAAITQEACMHHEFRIVTHSPPPPPPHSMSLQPTSGTRTSCWHGLATTEFLRNVDAPRSSAYLIA